MERSSRSRRNRALLSDVARANDKLLNIQRFSSTRRYLNRSTDSLNVSRTYVSTSSFERSISQSQRSSIRRHRPSQNQSADNDDWDNNNNHQVDSRRRVLDNKTDNVIGCIDTLRDKHDTLATSFDDFESNLRKTREKMNALLNKHSNVNDKLENGDDGKHWEYFQRQNKLLNMAVSKLCLKEGINVEDLLNEDAQHWRLKRNVLEDDDQET